MIAFFAKFKKEARDITLVYFDNMEEKISYISDRCSKSFSTITDGLHQCDQIGQFLQVLDNKLSHKSSPNILVTFWAISNNVIIM